MKQSGWWAKAVTPNSDELLNAARHAAQRAYCPYSGFPVGAALRTNDGRIFVGCNIENASYGLTICAERVAMFSALAAGVREWTQIAVSCEKGHAESPGTLMPCGACRQVMQEFLLPDAEVVIDQVGVFRLSELLPLPFRLAE